MKRTSLPLQRREFVAGLAGAAAWPIGAWAQQPEGIRRIGMLIAGSQSDQEAQRRLAAFREELHKLGWEEARNIRIDARWAAPGDAAANQQFAKELVALQPDLIVASTTPPTAAVLQQTRTIPIIFISVNDPITSGFVESFRRLGGNATGFIILEPTIGGKWLEMLKEVAPRLERAAFLFNPAQAPTAEYYLTSFKAAAKSLVVEATGLSVRDKLELEAAIASQAPNGGVLLLPDAFLAAHRAEITSLSLLHKLPAIYYARFFVEVGGLLSYGPDLADSWRRAAGYVDSVLKGAKPADLPVQGPTKFELTVNLKTAKALGLNVPPTARPSRRGHRMKRREFIAKLVGAAALPAKAHRADKNTKRQPMMKIAAWAGRRCSGVGRIVPSKWTLRPLSRSDPDSGLAYLRQRFVRRRHLGWTASEPPHFSRNGTVAPPPQRRKQRRTNETPPTSGNSQMGRSPLMECPANSF